jgi:hypothetical protein
MSDVLNSSNGKSDQTRRNKLENVKVEVIGKRVDLVDSQWVGLDVEQRKSEEHWEEEHVGREIRQIVLLDTHFGLAYMYGLSGNLHRGKHNYIY